MLPVGVKVLLGLSIVINLVRGGPDIEFCLDYYPEMFTFLNEVKGKTFSQLTSSSILIDVNGKEPNPSQSVDKSTDILLVKTSEGIRQVQKMKSSKDAKTALEAINKKKAYCADGEHETKLSLYFAPDCFTRIFNCMEKDGAFYLIGHTYVNDMSNPGMLATFNKLIPAKQREVLVSFINNIQELHSLETIHRFIQPKSLLITDTAAMKTSIKLHNRVFHSGYLDPDQNERTTFSPPELVKNPKKYSSEIDVYSLALSFAWILVEDKANFKLADDCFLRDFSKSCENELEALKSLKFTNEKMTPLTDVIYAAANPDIKKRTKTLAEFSQAMKDKLLGALIV